MIRSRGARAAAFTILELLIVMGIIAVLAGLIVPSVTRIRETSKAVQCQANLRALFQAMTAFAVDNDNRLPGNYYDQSNANPSQRDWLMGSGGFTNAPQTGTLFSYLGGSADTYLCPKLQNAEGLTTGEVSNGRFDYAALEVWTGAPLNKINAQSRMYWPDGHFDTLPTPVVVQEAPDHINGPNMEGAHSNVDIISHIHFGGSYYAAVDGSVQFVNESPMNSSSQVGAWVWQSRAPSGAYKSMATTNITWGFWEHQ